MKGVHAVVQLKNYKRTQPHPPMVFNRTVHYDSDADIISERCHTPEPRPHLSPSGARRLLKKQKKADKKTILIYNLPTDVNRQDIMDLFEVYGTIRFITIPLDDNFRIMGFAFIEYKHKRSVCNAILNKRDNVFGERVLKVESKRTYMNKVARRRAKGKNVHDVTAQPYRYEMH